MKKLIISFMLISALLVGCYTNEDQVEQERIENEIIEEERQEEIIDNPEKDLTDEADEVFNVMQSEIQVKEGQRFIVQFDPIEEENLEWILNEQVREGLNLEKKSETQWLFYSKSIGEYFLTFELMDPSNEEVEETIVIQVFVQNTKTTLGNIFEVEGIFEGYEDQMLKISDESKEYQIYVPENMTIEAYENGDELIAAIEVGETSYILRFLESNNRPIDGPSGKAVITHIASVEKMGDMYLGLLINDYYLEMFDNDLVNNNYELGDYVIVKYIANHDTESNELIFIQKVE